jgi:hypothetical protein
MFASQLKIRVVHLLLFASELCQQFSAIARNTCVAFVPKYSAHCRSADRLAMLAWPGEPALFRRQFCGVEDPI